MVERLTQRRNNQVTTQVKLNGSGKMVSRDGATGNLQIMVALVALLGAVDLAVCVTTVRIIRMDVRVSGH